MKQNGMIPLFSVSVVFILSLIVNYFYAVNGERVRQISDIYLTLITPASFTFSIWGLIYALIFLNIIYWWYLYITRPEHLEDYIPFQKILLGLTLLNMLWLFLWVRQSVFLAWCVILAMGILLLKTVKMLNVHSKHELCKKMLHLYHAWILVAVSLNTLTVFQYMGFNVMNSAFMLVSIAVLLVLSMIALYYLDTKARREYVLVLLWAFFGIFAQRNLMLPYHIIIQIVVIALLLLLGISWIIYEKRIKKYTDT